MKARVLVVTLFVVATSTLLAQERVDEQVIAAIKTEGFQRSQVMETLSWLTDVHGPRLTNSPGYKAAADWAKAQLERWGLVNARLEPWGTFGPGWSVDRYSVEMTEPSYARLIAQPHAWTRSTPGVVTGAPVLVEIASKSDFAKYKGKLKDAIVLLNKLKPAQSRFKAPAVRYTDAELREQEAAIHPGRPESYQAEEAQWEKESLSNDREIMRFLRDEGIAVLVEPSVRDGLIVEVAAVGYFLSNTEPWFPAFVMAKEHYGRLLRLLEKNVPVKLEISLRTTIHEQNLQGHNLVAEIPGSDPQIGNQVVMLGGHFDSWHSGTGTTDNAAGCSVVMEAVRILKAIGVKPRRTIRVALWDGEEQAFYGSIGYIKSHFGDPDTKVVKPEQALVSAYFNVDNGSGRIRGIHLQGNEAVRPIFEAWLKPFNYLGATSLTTRNTGGTDHLIFHAIGIPGFQFVQDPLDYDSQTHHTDLDVYESAVADDLQQAAVVLASLVYHAAMRDEMLPRHAMPKPWTK